MIGPLELIAFQFFRGAGVGAPGCRGLAFSGPPVSLTQGRSVVLAANTYDPTPLLLCQPVGQRAVGCI